VLLMVKDHHVRFYRKALPPITSPSCSIAAAFMETALKLCAHQGANAMRRCLY